MSTDFLLAIETSSPRGSVALGRSDALVAHRVLSAQRRHTGELLPAMQEMLRSAGARPREVGVLCFSQGPGSFTGLRVAATIARLWHSATGCRVVGVPSLDVIARNAAPAGAADDAPAGQHVGVAVDARSERIYGAVYRRAAGGGVECVAPAAVHELDVWLAALPCPVVVLGDAVGRYGERFAAAAGLTALPPERWYPDAREVLALGGQRAAAGEFLEPGHIVPAYLRPPECEEVFERRRAEARARRGES